MSDIQKADIEEILKGIPEAASEGAVDWGNPFPLALSDCAPEFYLVGDCSIPKNIMQATSMADAAVKDLGRL